MFVVNIRFQSWIVATCSLKLLGGRVRTSNISRSSRGRFIHFYSRCCDDKFNMACSAPSEKATVKVERDRDNELTVQTETKNRHRFSEPWEDSDLVLVVEEEKFHVHRVILSMNSPVFKAMFSSQFKEAASNEIPLPGKKMNEVLDFLKHIYYQHIQEPVKITMENVEYLLKLSDEYQVKLIFKPCIRFLENQPKTKENAMKLLLLADMYHLDDVRQGCCDDLLKDMKLKTLSEAVHLQGLHRESVQHVLSQRIVRLEAFLDTLYPQFLGLVECVMWQFADYSESEVAWCRRHFDDVNGCLMHRFNIDDAEIRRCLGCQQMLRSLVKATYKKSYGSREYHYGSGTASNHHFNEYLQAVIEDFVKLKHAGCINTVSRQMR